MVLTFNYLGRSIYTERNIFLKNHGTLIKKIRLEKGLSQKDIYEGIMTRQTYYLIESNSSMPSFDKFLLILEKLFITVDEFLNLLDSEHFPTEKTLYHELTKIIFNKNQNELSTLIKKTNQLYKKTNNTKYFHLKLIAQAMFYIHFEKKHFTKMDRLEKLMAPIKDYLTGIDSWYLYELKLLNNTLYCFTLDEAIALVTLISKKIEALSQTEEYQDIKLRIYLNLSFLCLKHKSYQSALHFSTLAEENAHINYRLFERIAAEINYELAKALLNKTNHLDEKTHQLINLLKVLDFNEIANEYQKILSENQLA